MEKNDLTTTLENNINKVLKNFGLDNVDVKIYKNDNGKKAYDHVYTKDGETKHEHVEGDNADDEVKFNNKKINSFEELKNFFDKKTEEINDTYDTFFERSIPIFKDTYMKKGSDYLNKKIDEVGENIINDPFLQTFMEILGIKPSAENVKKECELLKDRIAKSCNNNSDNEGEGGSKSLAKILKNSIINERNAEIQRKKEEALKKEKEKEIERKEYERTKKIVVSGIYNEIDKLIKQRNFQLLSDDLESPDAGICILFDEKSLKSIKIEENFKFDVTKSVIDEVGHKIKKDYQFTDFYSVPVDNNRIKMIFKFN